MEGWRSTTYYEYTCVKENDEDYDDYDIVGEECGDYSSESAAFEDIIGKVILWIASLCVICWAHMKGLGKTVLSTARPPAGAGFVAQGTTPGVAVSHVAAPTETQAVAVNANSAGAPAVANQGVVMGTIVKATPAGSGHVELGTTPPPAEVVPTAVPTSAPQGITPAVVVTQPAVTTNGVPQDSFMAGAPQRGKWNASFYQRCCDGCCRNECCCAWCCPFCLIAIINKKLHLSGKQVLIESTSNLMIAMIALYVLDEMIVPNLFPFADYTNVISPGTVFAGVILGHLRYLAREHYAIPVGTKRCCEVTQEDGWLSNSPCCADCMNSTFCQPCVLMQLNAQLFTNPENAITCQCQNLDGIAQIV